MARRKHRRFTQAEQQAIYEAKVKATLDKRRSLAAMYTDLKARGILMSSDFESQGRAACQAVKTLDQIKKDQNHD